MRPATDQQLLMLTASHDHSAFAALYDRHAETVARYLWAWVEDRDAVQDLVQETFVTAWQKAPGVDEIEALSETDRRICELCLVQGWPYREAAAELGHFVSALAKRLQRARARIREAELTHD